MPATLGSTVTGSSTPGNSSSVLSTVADALGGGFFGVKPIVPGSPSLGQSQSTAISENQTALPGAENLTSGVNQFNQSQLNNVLNQVIPGWQGIMGQEGNTIASEIAGQLPTSVQNQIQTSDAAKAFAGGFGGSGMSSGLTARDLGLSSLQLTQQGLNNSNSWMAMAKQNLVAPQMNVQGMFVSPQDQYNADVNTWKTQWLQAQVNAAPDPTLAGVLSMAGSMFGAKMPQQQQFGAGGMGPTALGGNSNFNTDFYSGQAANAANYSMGSGNEPMFDSSYGDMNPTGSPMNMGGGVDMSSFGVGMFG